MLSGGGRCRFADLDALRLGGAPGALAEMRLHLMPPENAAVLE